MVEFIDSLARVQQNAKRYPQWQAEQTKRRKEREAWLEEHPASESEQQKSQEYARVMVDAINTMDAYAINKSEDVATLSKTASGFVVGAFGIVAELGGLLWSVSKHGKKTIDGWARGLMKQNNFIGETARKMGPFVLEQVLHQVAMIAPLLVVSIVATVPVALLTGQFEKQAARVARFQARQNKLYDPKNFVQYTPEQLAIAKANADDEDPGEPPTNKNANALNPFSGFGILAEATKTAQDLTADNHRYEAWKKNFHAEEEALEAKQEAEKEQPATDAEKRQAVLEQRRLNTIIQAVELQSQTYVSNAEKVVGATMGTGEVLAGLLALVNWGLLSAGQAIKLLPSDADKPIMNFLKNGPGLVLPILAMFLPTLLAPSSVQLIKDAARIGRFKAKQELMANPQLFLEKLGRTEQQPEDEKPKTLWEKVIEPFKQLKQYHKDTKAYKEWEKDGWQEEKKLEQALKHTVKPTEQQLKGAKTLQSQAFYAFETIDEQTQRLADDTETRTNVIEQLVSPVLGIVANLSMLGVILYMAAKTVGGLKPKQGANLADKAQGFAQSLSQAFLPAPLAVLAFIVPFAPLLALGLWGANARQQAAQVGVMLGSEKLEDPKKLLNAPKLPMVIKRSTDKDAEATGEPSSKKHKKKRA
jgi:hypothetical protein